MTVKKVIGKIHLWLGLGSGVVVLFLGITGCLLAFETEIRSFTEPQQFVNVENKPYLPPSILKAEAEKYLYNCSKPPTTPQESYDSSCLFFPLKAYEFVKDIHRRKFFFFSAIILFFTFNNATDIKPAH